MAVTTQNSTEYTNATASPVVTLNPTTDYAGRVRIMHFTHAQSGAGDATSSVALGTLPAGKVKVLLASSNAYVNWTTASATLDLGWDAYTDGDGNSVAADADGLLNGLNVDTAGQFSLGSGQAATGGTYTFNSKSGVTIRATSQDTAIADGDDLVGYILYVVD
jgi:hypothetical protein